MPNQIIEGLDARALISVYVRQVILRIDAYEARIMHVERGIHCDSIIQSTDALHTSTEHDGNETTTSDSTSYFQQVARALDAADEILIVGPCATKVEFVEFLNRNTHATDARVLGVETIAKLNDQALDGFARLYFTVGGPFRNGGRHVEQLTNVQRMIRRRS
jgi:stalled ribosome rescue protein Dom34